MIQPNRLCVVSTWGEGSGDSNASHPVLGLERHGPSNVKLKRQNEIVLIINKANQPAGEEKKKEHGSYVFRFQTPRFNYNWFWHFFKEKNLLYFLGGFEDMFLLFVITIFFPTIAMIYGLHLTPPCKSQSHPASSHKEHMASRCLHCIIIVWILFFTIITEMGLKCVIKVKLICMDVCLDKLHL